MSLRIENQGQQPISNTSSTARTAQSQPRSAEGSAVAASNVDTASIRSASGELAGGLAIRQDRVDALRTQIAAGTYQPDPQAIASAMFQNYFRS